MKTEKSSLWCPLHSAVNKIEKGKIKIKWETWIAGAGISVADYNIKGKLTRCFLEYMNLNLKIIHFFGIRKTFSPRLLRLKERSRSCPKT